MFVALFWRIWAIFYPLDLDPDPHLLSVSRRQRRRIELEDKAKVVASVWGTEFVQFLAALAVLPWSI